MQIAATVAYRIIQPFEPLELPRLTILTGRNGSGKSLLLSGLNSLAIRCDLFGELVPSAAAPEMMVPSLTGHPKITLLKNWSESDQQFKSQQASKIGARFAPAAVTQRGIRHTYPFEPTRTDILRPFRIALEDALGLFSVSPVVQDPWTLGIEQLLLDAKIAADDNRADVVEKIFSDARAALQGNEQTDPMLGLFNAELINAADEFRVDILQVTSGMIEIMRTRISGQMFDPNIVELFSLYRDNKFGNDMDEIQGRSDPNRTYLEPHHFIEQFGPPPWEMVSSLLAAMALPFEVLPPSPDMTSPCQFRLRSLVGGEEIGFADLSSGEQVILRFAVSVMRPNPSMIGLQRPLLLLLDELDASLHPEMVQRWLGAIERGIVGELGIHVILTTHSPTTVALAPEGSIFALEDHRPVPVSKQEAINRLTFGVPTLSIDYSGRRQIFCESDTDAAAYEKIYAAVKPRLHLQKELTFIGVGIRVKSKIVESSRGEEMHAGEAVVREITKNLADRGVSSVYGLIDWDAKATPTPRVFIVGAGTYYTIENILLDPLLIGALMVLERMEIPGLQISPRGLDLLDATSLQQLADAIQNALKLPDDNGDLIDVEYLGGSRISLRKRYASINGHQLEEELAKAFSPLKRYTSNRGALTRRISDIVITDFPEFCPKAVSDVFMELSNC